MTDPLEKYGAAFHQLLDAAPDAMVVVNESGKVVLVNAMVETLFGYSRAELLGQPIEMLLPQRFRSAHAGHIRGFTKEPRVRRMGEGQLLFASTKAGREFPVEVSLSPMQTERGMLVTAAIRDISERVKAEQTLKRHAEELARSNADLEQFAYVASHDLQEPLRTISSFAQLLARRYKGKLDADADEFIDFVVDGAARMQTLINDLLTFSRVTTRGKQFASTDCNAVMGYVKKNLELVIGETQATIDIENLPTVNADASQLVQLFQNLVSNAIKFRKPDVPPRIAIEAKDQQGMIQFSVKDNGIGFEPQYADRIFLLFQRLHGKRDYPGTGIGLAVCKKIVERHGGRIWVESTPGVGATFHFTLPKTPTNI